MKSLQFDLKLHRYAAAKALGRFIPQLYWHPRYSCLQYKEVSEPKLPDENWVKVEVTYAGICGSDLNLIYLHDSPSVSPFTSFPFTIGHEIIGTILECGRNVDEFKLGQRIVIDPILSCAARGIITPCPACNRGDYSLCDNMTEGSVAPGLLTGACRDTGGGWSSRLVVHRSQLLTLPPSLNEMNAVMIEPFSCALHAILQNPPNKGDHVLVIGAGSIGLCVIAALRALEIDCKITVLSKYDFQSKLARHYGADEIVQISRDRNYIFELAALLQAKVWKPIIGEPISTGGADRVYECVGHVRSIRDAFCFSKKGASIILLGLASLHHQIDWSMVWLKELKIIGSFAYGMDEYFGRKMRTLQIAINLMQAGKVDLSMMVTHRFPLHEYRKAILTAAKKAKTESIKVVFEL